jgi:uncharacterized damage-inducible protein DinB
MKHAILKLLSVFIFFTALLITNKSFAQPSLNAEEVKAQLIKDWQRAKDYTNEYLNAMPAEKYSFRAVDSIRSFAQQMLHLAQANLFLISNGTGMSKNFGGNLEQRPSAQSKDSVVYYVNSSYDFVIDAVSKLDPSKLGEKVKWNNFEVSRLGWILKTFEHQTHHRGQATIYIRLAGIRPPNEKLF